MKTPALPLLAFAIASFALSMPLNAKSAPPPLLVEIIHVPTLRAARKAARLTQADAAKLCGVSKRTLEKWEAGELSPPPEALAITRERVLARLTEAKACPLGNPNTTVSQPGGQIHEQ